MGTPSLVGRRASDVFYHAGSTISSRYYIILPYCCGRTVHVLRNGQLDCRNPRRRYRRTTAMKDTTRATVITIPLFLAGTVFGCIDRTIHCEWTYRRSLYLRNLRLLLSTPADVGIAQVQARQVKVTPYPRRFQCRGRSFVLYGFDFAVTARCLLTVSRPKPSSRPISM